MVDRTRKIRPRPTARPAVTPVLPRFDRDLTYYQEGSRWSFSDGKILLDGYDVNQLISEPDASITTWLGLASGLDDYRKKVVQASLPPTQTSRFHAVIEALLGKLFSRLKKVYDEKTTGISWTIQNGQLIVNRINVRQFLALFRIRRTEKARTFLEGLKGKLALLMEGQENEKIRGTLQDLYDEISDELASQETPRPARPLPHRRPLDS